MKIRSGSRISKFGKICGSTIQQPLSWVPKLLQGYGCPDYDCLLSAQAIWFDLCLQIVDILLYISNTVVTV